MRSSDVTSLFSMKGHRRGALLLALMSRGWKVTGFREVDGDAHWRIISCGVNTREGKGQARRNEYKGMYNHEFRPC